MNKEQAYQKQVLKCFVLSVVCATIISIIVNNNVVLENFFDYVIIAIAIGIVLFHIFGFLFNLEDLYAEYKFEHFFNFYNSREFNEVIYNSYYSGFEIHDILKEKNLKLKDVVFFAKRDPNNTKKMILKMVIKKTNKPYYYSLKLKDFDDMFEP